MTARTPEAPKARKPAVHHCPEGLSARFDGESDLTGADLDARLASDPELARELQRFAAVSRLLQAPVEPDPGFVVRFRARREAQSVIPRWTWPQLGRRLAAAAAVLLVAAALTYLGNPFSPSDEAPAAVAAADPTPPEALLLLEGELLAGASPSAGPPAAAATEPVLQIALGAPVLSGLGPGR